MAQLSIASPPGAAPRQGPAPRPGRQWLYKDDHPRAIDRHIDFFGDRTPRAAAADSCGEALLESLA